MSAAPTRAAAQGAPAAATPPRAAEAGTSARPEPPATAAAEAPPLLRETEAPLAAQPVVPPMPASAAARPPQRPAGEASSAGDVPTPGTPKIEPARQAAPAPPRPLSRGTTRALDALASPAKKNHVGTISLLVTVAGTAGSHYARTLPSIGDAEWLRVLSAGFEAGLIGGLADWFAVTALFRHPLGIPIPHTAILPARRDKIIESIVAMVEDEWLSPDVIGARLRSITPSELVTDWLKDDEHVQRLGAPLRDLLASVARILAEPEVVEFVGRNVRSQLASFRIDASAGRWLEKALDNRGLDSTFESTAMSIATLLSQPETAEALQGWLDQASRVLHRDGSRVVPMLLRRQIVRRTIVEAGCRYAVSELLYAIDDEKHPIRRWVFDSARSFAKSLAAGDADAIAMVERVRSAVVETLEVEPLVGDLLTRLADQISNDLDDPDGYLTELVDRKLRGGVLQLLDEPERRAKFDDWVRATADDLLRKNHHQIGVTVRENLEALETDVLIRQIENRVGSDLQFIRLNGALVGGLIGVLLALLRIG